jgi:hypothetical protein
MITKIKWIERSFELNYPLGMFPNFLERVRGTPPRLEELLHSFPKEILTIKPEHGWSIQEHAGHLVDLDELHSGRVDDFIFRAKVLRAWDGTNRKTHDANHNVNSIRNILMDFRAARTRLVNRLERLDYETHHVIAQHPRIQKPMRVVDMVYFTAEHDDHHLSSITELARTLLRKGGS